MSKQLELEQAAMRERWSKTGEHTASKNNDGTSRKAGRRQPHPGPKTLSGPEPSRIQTPISQKEAPLREQRHNKRYELQTPFSPLLRWKGRTGEHDGCISDIGMGGCFLNTPGEAAVGEIITFRTRVQNGPLVELRGEVTHHQKRLTGFGVRFVYQSIEERMLVSLLVVEASDRA